MFHTQDIVASFLNGKYIFTLIFPDLKLHLDKPNEIHVMPKKKMKKHTFRNLHNFVQYLTNKLIVDKLPVFSDKILHVLISNPKQRMCEKPG